MMVVALSVGLIITMLLLGLNIDVILSKRHTNKTYDARENVSKDYKDNRDELSNRYTDKAHELNKGLLKDYNDNQNRLANRRQSSAYVKELTNKLNQPIVFEDGTVNRLWKYLNIDESTDLELEYDVIFLEEPRFTHPVFNFNKRFPEFSNPPYKHEVKSLKWFDDIEQKAILLEVETIEKLSTQFVRKILDIIIEKSRIKNERMYQGRINKAFSTYHAIDPNETSVLEKSMREVSEELKHM